MIIQTEFSTFYKSSKNFIASTFPRFLAMSSQNQYPWTENMDCSPGDFPCLFRIFRSTFRSANTHKQEILLYFAAAWTQIYTGFMKIDFESPGVFPLEDFWFARVIKWTHDCVCQFDSATNNCNYPNIHIHMEPVHQNNKNIKSAPHLAVKQE